MTVFVNNMEIRVFRGARVKDAIRAYFAGIREAIPYEWPVIADQYGNITDYDGELLSLQRLYTIDHRIANETEPYENL